DPTGPTSSTLILQRELYGSSLPWPMTLRGDSSGDDVQLNFSEGLSNNAGFTVGFDTTVNKLKLYSRDGVGVTKDVFESNRALGHFVLTNHLGSTKVQSAAPPATVDKRLPLYDDNNTLIGYIPIHT